MSDPTRFALVAHLGATLFMAGLIWYVQIVHYPMFDMAERATFASWEARHSALTTWVVAPAMLIEAATAVWLAVGPPQGVPAAWARLGVALVAGIWTATAFLSVPLHGRLSGGWDAEAHRLLVATHWVRTVLWSARAMLVLAIAAQRMR
jgi:uncharacterized membrane protein